MKLLPIIVLSFVLIVPLGHAVGQNVVSGLPADVAEFKTRRDLCDHFRGEYPYNEERRKFLEENLTKYCTGTDKELASLNEKYKNNETVLKALAGYEERIEGSK
jgi:hypothetical protein